MRAFFFKRHCMNIRGPLVLFLVFWASTTLATTSRINSLGGNGDYFEDDANVIRWFGSLTDYPDQIVIKSGNFNIPDGYWQTSSQKVSGPGAGAHYNLGLDGKFGTLAFFFQNHHDDDSFSLTPQQLRNNLSFLYAFDLGPLTAAAFFSHGSRLINFNDTEIDYSANTVGLGSRINLSETAYLDLAGESQFTNIQNSSFSELADSDSENNFSLRGRAFVALGDRSALVPVVEIIHEDKLHPFLVPVRHDNQLLRLGMGLDYFPDTDHLLLLNVELVDGKTRAHISDSFIENTWTSWNLKAGFESRILSWLTTRGSVGYVDHHQESMHSSGSAIFQIVSPESPTLNINLGASLHLGPGDLDLSFGDNYPNSAYTMNTPELQKRWLSATARLFF